MSADNLKDERQAPEATQKDTERKKKKFAVVMKHQLTSKAPTITSKSPQLHAYTLQRLPQSYQ